MNFARKELEKYGWKEGEGLGKNKSGISKALKPKLKFDTGGLGQDSFEDINNTWWQRLYDEAAKNIVTKKNEDDSVTLGTVEHSIEITTKKKKSKKRNQPVGTVYTNFVKTCELSDNVEKRIIEDECEELEVKREKKMTSGICDYTDEELFRICGGRTAHKGARHGLKMSAKLARIEQQENSEVSNSIMADTLKEKLKKKQKTKRERRKDE